MFKYVCDHFAKATGRDSLIPVDSVDHASSVKLLQIVVMEKKRDYVIWTKKVYKPYDFLLGDLLMNAGTSVKVDGKQTEFCTWKKNFTFTIKGKFGEGMMHDLADVNVRAKDKVTVQANLGKINMKKIDSEELLAALANRRLDLGHTLVQQIQRNKKNVLCIVTAVAELDANAEIQRVTGQGANAGAGVEEGEVDAEADASVSLNRIKDIGLVGGTAIAYRIWELQIGKDSGTIVPCVSDEVHGGFIDDDEFIGQPVRNSFIDGPTRSKNGIIVGTIEGAAEADESTDTAERSKSPEETPADVTVDAPATDDTATTDTTANDITTDNAEAQPVENEDTAPPTPAPTGTEDPAPIPAPVVKPPTVILGDLKAELLPKTLSSKLRPVMDMNPEGREGLRNVLKQLSTSDMDALDKILDTAEDSLKAATVQEQVVNLEQASFSDKPSCASFLRFAEFQQKSDNELSYPVDTSPMFIACAYIIGAFAELAKDTELFQLLRDLEASMGEPLLNLMLRAFKGPDKLIPVDSDISVVTGNEHAMKILTSLSFTADSQMLVVPASLTEKMSQLSWCLYAMYKMP